MIVEVFEFSFQDTLPRTGGIITPSQWPVSPGILHFDLGDRCNMQSEIGAVIRIEIISFATRLFNKIKDGNELLLRNEFSYQFIPVM